MRKTASILMLLLGFVFFASVFLPQSVHAVPAFARQTGLACSSCHFQHYPTLNAFGRAFKAGGYTMVGGQSLIEGDMLSLPSVLNASMVLKVMYQKTNGDEKTGTNMGALKFPDEAALLIGGRAGEHVGFLLEAGLTPGETEVNIPSPVDDSISVPETNLFTSFKMPFVYDLAGSKVSVIPFITDAAGAPYGFELLNTGALRMSRTLEHRGDISAQQYVGTDGAAEGVAIVGYNSMGYINATLWTPNHGEVAVNRPAYYVRVAATPTVSGWDVGGGIQYWTGKAGRDDDGGGDIETNALAIDAQAQGKVGAMPLGIYVTYANAPESDTDMENLFNADTEGAINAISFVAELGVLPNKATVALGYRAGDTGADDNNKDNALFLGATYQLVQNVQFQFNQSLYSGDFYDLAANNEDDKGDQKTTLMLFTAF